MQAVPAAATHTRRLLFLPLLLRRTTTTMATAPPANGGAPAPAAAAAAAPTPTPAPAADPASTRPAVTAPLSAVVKDAVQRWYEDALREAERGDVVSEGERRAGGQRLGGGGCALSPPDLITFFSLPLCLCGTVTAPAPRNPLGPHPTSFSPPLSLLHAPITPINRSSRPSCPRC